MKVAVAFLMRGGPGAADSVRAFVKSYKEKSAGYPHDLVVMVKAWNPPSDGEIEEILSGLDHRLIELPDDGFDWGAYIRTARALEHEWILFLNTHSRLLSNGWLLKMMKAALDTGGLVGATGSWGSIYNPLMSAWPAVVFTYRNRGILKALIGAAIRIAQFSLRAIPTLVSFSPPPNPHVRSNGFLIRRRIFCEFADTVSIPQSKLASFKLESGRRGLTRFIMRRGIEPIIVGANGRAYKVSEWPQSCTFQNPNLSNLLISDNQTRLYLNSSSEIQRCMERAAWCHAFSIKDRSKAGDPLE